MPVAIQFRRDNAATWLTANPILLEGEIGVELDTKQFKIGDGASTWAELEYAQRGPRGYEIQYSWNGTQLGLKRADEASYTYANLKGEQGIQGIRGYDFQFTWDGTQLGVKTSNDAEYVYVNLKGEQGIQGIQGIQGPRGYDLQFIWDGTSLGVRTSDQLEYSYVNLKGEQGVQGPKGDQGPGNLNHTGAWVTATLYSENDIVKAVDSLFYRCTAEHMSGGTTEPGEGESWESSWELFGGGGGGGGDFLVMQVFS